MGFVKKIWISVIALLFSIGIFAIAGSKPVMAVDDEQVYGATPLTFAGIDDSVNGPINLGFTFNYFGSDYTQAYVSTNGVMSFGSGYTDYSNTNTGLNNAIHAFWDDLIIQVGVSNIYSATIGEEGSRKFITQWTSMYFFSTTVTMGTFQVILYEGSNDIRIQYRDLLGGSRSNGDSATIGIKNSGSTFLMYSFNTSSIIEGQSILYSPNGEGSYTVNSSAVYDPVYLQSSDAPDSPILVNPQNGISGATVTPTFEWLSANQATSYQLLISTVSTFSSTVVNQSGITDTNYTLGSPLNYNTTYYWRVVGVNSYGTNMSSSRTFQTSSVPNTSPDTPTSFSPTNWNNGDPVGPIRLVDGSYEFTLNDTDEDDQVRYRIQVSKNSEFSELVIDYRSSFGGIGERSFEFGSTDGTYLIGSSDYEFEEVPYYIRVRAEDSASASSDWYTVSGVAFTFDDTAPDILDKPFQIGEANSNGTVKVGWNESSDIDLASPAYTIQFSTYPEFNIINYYSTDALEYNFTGLSHSTTYYFRVFVYDIAGNNSPFSEVLSLHIPTPVIPPILPPANGGGSNLNPLNPITKITKPIFVSPPSGISNSESESEDDPEILEKVILDYLEGYKGEKGVKLGINGVKVIYFFVNTEEHSARLKEVGEDYVVIVISSDPFEVALKQGEVGIYDVNKDRVDDIEIAFIGFEDGEPVMNFKQIDSQTNADENQIIMDLDRRDFINWIPVTVLITLVVSVYLYRKYRVIKK